MNTSYGRELEDAIAAFERQKKLTPEVDVCDFFPSEQHPVFSEIAVELLRVDLEYEWENGARDTLQTYRNSFPVLLEDADNLKPLAFEDYRLRYQAGEPVDKAEYERRFGIDASDWPTFSSSTINTDDPRSLVDRIDQAAFPKPGNQLHDFELIAELGRGTFSRVFLARQGDLANRFVVVKTSTERWIESDLLARLQHTNIVPIYSVHHTDGFQVVCMPFLGCSTLSDALAHLFGATELGTAENDKAPPKSREALLSTVANHQSETLTNSIPSGELRDRVERQIALASRHPANSWRNENLSYVESCLRIVADLADGLAHAHEVGIVHRDLKPANILLTDDGRPMILDFNLSHDMQSVDSDGISVGGTLPYMAPEHLEAMVGTGTPNAQSDIYSLGIILFEMLTGRRPFPDHRGDLTSIVKQMIDDRRSALPRMQHLNCNVSKSVESIVQRCLETDPGRRYGEMQELREDLTRQLENRPLRFAREPSVTERFLKWTRRYPKLASTFTVAMASMLIIISILSAWRMRERHVARVNAVAQFVDFQEGYRSARLALSSPSPSSVFRNRGLVAVDKQIDRFGLLDDDFEKSPEFQLLDVDDQATLKTKLAELLFLKSATIEQVTRSLEDPQRRKSLLQEALDLNQLAARGLVDPRNSRPFLLQEAKLRFLLGDEEDAKLLRDSAVGPSQNDFFNLYLSGLEYAASGDNAQAIKDLTAALKLEPLDYVGWLARGKVFATIRRFDQADDDFSRCIALQPHSPVPWFFRGLSRLESRSFQKASTDFNEVIRLQADLASAYVYRGMIRYELGKIQPAIDDLNRALELGSRETRIYFLRSKLKRLAGDHRGAELDRLEGMSRPPTDESSWIMHGMAQLPDKPQSALSDLGQALRINPQSYTALRNSAYVLSDFMDRNEDAIRVLDQILAMRPEDTEIIAGRAVLLARIEEYDQAYRGAEQALRIRQDAQTLIHAACVYALAARKKPDGRSRSIALIRRGLKLDPNWVTQIKNDPDLTALHDHDDFQEVVAAATLLVNEHDDQTNVARNDEVPK